MESEHPLREKLAITNEYDGAKQVCRARIWIISIPRPMLYISATALDFAHRPGRTDSNATSAVVSPIRDGCLGLTISLRRRHFLVPSPSQVMAILSFSHDHSSTPCPEKPDQYNKVKAKFGKVTFIAYPAGTRMQGMVGGYIMLDDH